MPKSRKRGGAKAHRKRVQKRNEKLGIAQKQFQKVFSQMYETKMNELKEKFENLSAMTENLETKNEEVIQEGKTESSSSEGTVEQSN